MKPIIGITTGIASEASVQASRQDMYQLGDTYTKAVESAGGIPVMLPAYADIELARECVRMVDALIFSGGSDFDPHLFGMRPTDKCRRIMPRRDAFEFALGSYALEETEIPILGICRGCQLLNVLRGGKLHLDLSEEGKLPHQLTMYPREQPSHFVRIAQGTRLHDFSCEEEIGVNSFHHQAVSTLGSGFVATAYSIPDNVIEAIEIVGSRFVVGVQWHPEGMMHNSFHHKLFARLIEAAREGMREREGR